MIGHRDQEQRTLENSGPLLPAVKEQDAYLREDPSEEAFDATYKEGLQMLLTPFEIGCDPSRCAA